MSRDVKMDRMRANRSGWRSFLNSRDTDAPVDLKIGLAASFTVDPLIPYLGSRALAARHNPLILNADYNQLMQVCFGHDAVFAGNLPDAIVLLWRIEDLADWADMQSLEAAATSLLHAVGTLRENYVGMIIISLPPRPRPATTGLVGFSRLQEVERLWHKVCLNVADLCQTLRGVYCVDIEASITAMGNEASHDERKALLYRQPYSELVYDDLAIQIYRLLAARTLSAKKCLVLDGDNTLWGGIVGEDGVGGVAIGQDFPGSAFRAFQQQIKLLQRSGIFIAINSKNNPDDVWELFDKRREMILQKNDFSVCCVNWMNKSENLRTIARELNIGLDALVFIDDSHFEIAEVNAQTPEVTTLQMPADLSKLPALLQDHAYLFDRLDLTDDDRNRVGMMRQEEDRKELAGKLTQEEFLASLSLVLNIYSVEDTDVARVTQLVNKTNQFNLTTQRYDAADVERIRNSQSHRIYCLSVRDRFGDYGLTGVAITQKKQAIAEFDTLLMSCRVLGRGIETAFISTIMQAEAERGISEMVGLYRPTNKNMMVADLFSRHGFEHCPETELLDHETKWRLGIESAPEIQSFLKISKLRPE